MDVPRFANLVQLVGPHTDRDFAQVSCAEQVHVSAGLSDPATDTQPLNEAISIGVPVIALCDANNETKYVDMVIPTNNKGRKALALVFYLLTREVQLSQERISSPSEFVMDIDDFESQL